jgi:hypothetical protein
MSPVFFLLFITPFLSAVLAENMKWFDRGCYQRVDEYQMDFEIRSSVMTHAQCQVKCSVPKNASNPNSPLLWGPHTTAAIYGPYMGTFLCYCGNRLPSKKVDDSKCNSDCPGTGDLKCGGRDEVTEYYNVYQKLPAKSVISIPTKGKWENKKCFERVDEYELDFYYKRHNLTLEDCQERCQNWKARSNGVYYNGASAVAAIYAPSSSPKNYKLCYCGPKMPSTPVDDNKCSSKCIDGAKCGGRGNGKSYYSVWQFKPQQEIKDKRGRGRANAVITDGSSEIINGNNGGQTYVVHQGASPSSDTLAVAGLVLGAVSIVLALVALFVIMKK